MKYLQQGFGRLNYLQNLKEGKAACKLLDYCLKRDLNFENEYAVVYLLINYTDLNDLTQMQSLKLLFKNDKDGSYSFSHYIVDKNSYQH